MLALGSRRGGREGLRLGATAAAAVGMGFASVHASTPPSDAATARAVLDEHGLSLGGVSTAPVHDGGALAATVERAVEAARALRDARVVLDLGPYVAGPRESREAAVDAVARALFDACVRFGGVALSVRSGAEAGTLFGLEETEWLLDALASRGLSTWLDPWRARRREGVDSARGALDWADRLARRAAGVFVHGGGPRREGHGLPEEGEVDWGTLLGLLPARALRVLDVGPEPGEDDVVETRRRFEERLGY